MRKIFIYSIFVSLCFALFSQFAAAQEKKQAALPDAYPPAQIAAMKRIDFLVGKWRGNGWVMGYNGKRIPFTNNESVELRLGGLIAVVEGLGKSKDSATGEERITHNAFAVLSYDPQAKVYRWRTHTFHGGPGLDITADIGDKNFVWGFKMPQVGDTRYTITLNEKGNWFEIGEMSRDGGKTWTKFLEMELEKVK